MEEILMTIDEESWEQIKSGKKTIEIRKSKPKNIFYPFRVIACVKGGVGVVGKFDVDSIVKTITPETLVKESCMTLKEILFHSDGKSVCGWHIKAGSVVEYETAFPLEMATGIKNQPVSWCYLNKDVENE